MQQRVNNEQSIEFNLQRRTPPSAAIFLFIRRLGLVVLVVAIAFLTAMGKGEKLPQSTSALSAMLLLMMMTMTILINPSDAQENEEDAETLAELERMKQEWFNPEFEPQTLKPEQLWFFNQILPGLDLDDIDLEVDEDEGPVDRPQAGEFADEPSCIRKEYRQLTQTEVDNFQSAMRTLKASGDYDTLVAYHHQSQSPAAHFGVAFLFWHLRYLILFENALRRINPSVCLPYWDTRLDCELPSPRESAMFTPQHFGGNWGAVRDGFARNWRLNTGNCDRWRTGVLTRWLNGDGCWRGLLYTQTDVNRYMSSGSLDRLVQPYDTSTFERDHGGVHVFVNGQMGMLECAPNDPLFWLHHCFVDCMGLWLKNRVAASQWIYPPDWWLSAEHRANAQMRPFNGFVNRHGLNDTEMEKHYTCAASPADRNPADRGNPDRYFPDCSTDADCSPVGLLWCHTPSRSCRAKARRGGACTLGFDAMCYCPTGTPRCTGTRTPGTCQC